MESELLPCPFCGGTVLQVVEIKDESLWRHSIVPFFYVNCNDCDLDGPRFCEDRDECIEHWNTRSPSQTEAKLDAVREVVQDYAAQPSARLRRIAEIVK